MPSIAARAFGLFKNPARRRPVSKNKAGVSVDVARLLAKYTLPVLDVEVDASGLARVLYKYPSAAGKSKLHYGANVAWDGKIHLPMDEEFLLGDQQGSDFPSYLRWT